MRAARGLAIKGVSHAFDAVRVVDDVDLAVAPGELVCLVGPSGCGKTTLLRIAAGLAELQRGAIAIDDVIAAEPGRALPPEARGVGLVFQDYALFPHLDVAGNVGFGLKGASAAERDARIDTVLDQVNMTEYRRAWPHQLSGGQQQRVALARALAPRPHVMLLDEPFSGLDTQLRAQIRDDTLHVLKHSGVATLMVTHDPEEAMFMADRIVVMNRGRVEQDGRPTEIYGKPATAFVARFFGEVNELRGLVRDHAVMTPFGSVTASGYAEGATVQVVIRPEGLKLSPAAQAAQGSGPSACYAKVLASRLLGRSSWVHLDIGGQAGHGTGDPAHAHFHARVPGSFLPAEGELLTVRLDPAQAFVFTAPDAG
jgi:iron(III) transport system ATP-binding protein